MVSVSRTTSLTGRREGQVRILDSLRAWARELPRRCLGRRRACLGMRAPQAAGAESDSVSSATLAAQLAAMQQCEQTWRAEVVTWQQLAEAAEAEQQALSTTVTALQTEVEQLHRKLDLSALQQDAQPKSAARLPRVLAVGGPNRRGETLTEARKQLHVEFDFVPSEREKGRTQGAMKSLRTRAANASAVLVVTDCCGHDKRNAAVETCRARGVPFREIRTLSASQLAAAVTQLLAT